MRGLPQKQNARRADKIRLCGHLRRYKKIVKKTYMILIKLDLQQKDLCKKMHNIFPTYDILEICWQKGEVHHAEGNKSEI